MSLLSSRTSLSWIDVNFLKQNLCILSCSGDFQFSTYFIIALNDSRCMSTPGASLSPCNSFFRVIYPIDLSVMSFLFSYLTPELFGFLYTQLLICSPFAIYKLKFSFVILESPVLFVLLDPVSVSLFRQYLLINLFKLYCKSYLLLCFDFFIPPYPCAFFLPKHFHLLSQFLYLSF